MCKLELRNSLNSAKTLDIFYQNLQNNIYYILILKSVVILGGSMDLKLKKIQNPFKTFFKNILLGLILLLTTFGGVFLSGHIFDNKVDDNVDAGAFNAMDIWIAQKVHYDKNGNSVDKARIILTSSPAVDVSVGCTVVVFWSYDGDVNNATYYQTSSDVEAYSYYSQNNKHVLTKFKPSQFNWVGVRDCGGTNLKLGDGYLTQNDSLGGTCVEAASPSGEYFSSEVGRYGNAITTSGDYKAISAEANANNAKWITYVEGVSSTITFNKQGGSGGTDSATAYYNEYCPKISIPTRPGYLFEGYYTGANGTGTCFYLDGGEPTSQIYNYTSNTTLYANWEELSYNFTFNKNGGSGGTSTLSGSCASAIENITIPTKSGQIFAGYYYNDTQVFDAAGRPSMSYWTEPGNFTLTARWLANKQATNVTYNPEGGAMDYTTDLFTATDPYEKVNLYDPSVGFKDKASEITYTSSSNTFKFSGTYPASGNIWPFFSTNAGMVGFFNNTKYTAVLTVWNWNSSTGSDLNFCLGNHDSDTDLDYTKENVIVYGINGNGTYKMSFITQSNLANPNIKQSFRSYWVMGPWGSSNTVSFNYRINIYIGEAEIDKSEGSLSDGWGRKFPTPLKSGYAFVGWSTVQGDASHIVSVKNTVPTTAHTLYAIYKKIVNVSFDSNTSSWTDKYFAGETYAKENLYNPSAVGFKTLSHGLNGAISYDETSNTISCKIKTSLTGLVANTCTFSTKAGMPGFVSNTTYTCVVYVTNWTADSGKTIAVYLGGNGGYYSSSTGYTFTGNGYKKFTFQTGDIENLDSAYSFGSYVKCTDKSTTISFDLRIEIYLGDVTLNESSGSLETGYARAMPTTSRSGYKFWGWSKTEYNPETFDHTEHNMDEILETVDDIVDSVDHTLYAVLEKKKMKFYDAKDMCGCHAGAYLSYPSGYYAIGQSVTFTVMANSGFSVGRWVVHYNYGTYTTSSDLRTLTYTVTEADCDNYLNYENDSSKWLKIYHEWKCTVNVKVDTNFSTSTTGGGTVKVDSGSFGTSGSFTQYCNAGTNAIYAKPASGYVFYGWFLRNTPTISSNLDALCLAKAGDCTYDSTNGYKFVFDHTTVLNPYDGLYGGGDIYALFLKQVTVSFNFNGGKTQNGATILEPKTLTCGLPYGNENVPTLTKDGYIFNGWTYNSSTILPETKVSTTSNHTLTASFTGNSYNVFFDANLPANQGGTKVTLSTTSKQVTYGSSYGDLPSPTHEGYIFEGWYKEKACTNRVYTSTTVSVANDHSLYAKWTAASRYLSVLAYTNGSQSSTGGTASASPSSGLTYGSAVTATASVKTGYIFAGWYSSTSFTTANFLSANPTYKFNIYGSSTSTQYLYARFISSNLSKVTIKYEFVGCTDNSSTTAGTYVVGTTITLKATPNSGYVFDKWEVSNGTGTITNATSTDASYIIQSSDSGNTLTFIAISRVKNYNVNFYLVEGSTQTLYSTETFNYGVSYTKPVPTLSGYTVDGWYTDSACTTGKATSFSNLTSTDGGVVNRYAKKTANTYVLTYNKNTTDTVSGLSSGTKQITYKQAFGTLPTLTRTGYNFGGWFKEADCINAVDANTICEGDQTIYAKWTSKTVGITINFSGCANANSSSTTALYKAGDVISLRAKPNTGYHFSAWTKTNGNGAILNANLPSTTYTITAADVQAGTTITFTATSVVNTYTIEFYVVENGNITLNSSLNATYGTSYTKTLPTQTGFTVTGWFNDENGTTKVTTLQNLTEINGAVVKLYAMKTVNSYTITYNLGSTTYTETYTYGMAKTLLTKADICAKQNVSSSDYVFYGWFTEDPTNKGNLKALATTSQLSNSTSGNKTFYGRFFKARETGVAGYSDASLTINVNINSDLKSGENYGVILIEYFDEELGYTRNYTISLTDGTFTISGLKYASIKISVITNIKAKCNYESVIVVSSSKSTSTVTLTLSKNDYNGYVDVGAI